MAETLTAPASTTPAAEKIRSRLLSPFLMRGYMLAKLPLALMAGLRVRELDRDRCVVTVPYGWRTTNPFRSTYFAAQAKPQKDTIPHVQLTDRENEVLLRVAKGFTLPEIGVQLNLSRHTIADYVKQIYRKLNVSSRAEAALEAQRLGLFGRGR